MFFAFQVTFTPQDNTQLCVVGHGIFKLFRYSEGNLKQFAFQKMEPQNYLCQAWVSDERVIVGTDNGKLFLFEAGELKNEFNLAAQQRQEHEKERERCEVWQCSKYVFKVVHMIESTFLYYTVYFFAHVHVFAICFYITRGSSMSDDDAIISSGPPQISSLVAYSKGFACACGPGVVYLYEKTDDKEFFKKIREIKVHGCLLAVSLLLLAEVQFYILFSAFQYCTVMRM